MSPRTEQLRYQEQHRHTPVRRPSPALSMNQMPSGSYGGPQTLAQPPAPPPSQPPQRQSGPNGIDSGVGSGYHGAHGPIAPYGRGNSPPPEIRPITENRPPSRGPNYSRQPYQHHPDPAQPGGIAAGAPPPTAALAAAEEAAARDRDDRPAAGFKRMIDADEEHKMPHKYPANGETRRHLDDQHHRRPSPPDRQPSPRARPNSPRGRQPSPRIRHRHSSSEARHEEQRRADENYYPSEAAHHPPTLPSMHQQPPPQPEHLPPMSEGARDDRRDAYEPVARPMEMDEDYDDEGEDDKRAVNSGGRNSPRGIVNGQTKQESSN